MSSSIISSLFVLVFSILTFIGLGFGAYKAIINIIREIKKK
nr:hypothetical protein OFPIXXUK_OFPIXXUK_CDS_0005 [Microvirus sp.]CAI9750769.1 hypothetical protein CTTEOEDQ_CTTEOEDQ_CDS_0005 [Microvirus sp.]